MNYNQYKVVLINLDPKLGSEIQKTRPCLIISPKEMNYSNIIVAPIASKYKDYPTRVKLKKDSYVVLDQIRTVSIKRIIKELDVKISSKKINEIKSIIKIMLVD
ncbi:type II toxin-antitoxin system PemK/MazF family toxin [Sulfurospirillum sp. 1307]|jgi:mRNA interferase MazF